MLLGETIRVAFGSIRANKLRATLTMLGVIIGVAAVITVVAMGTGAQKSVQDRINSLGANLTIEYNNGKIWRIMPRRNPGVNKSWISNRTRLLRRGMRRQTLPLLYSMVRFAPRLSSGAMLSTFLSSQTRCLNRKSLSSSAPTGQRSTTLPDQAWSSVCPSKMPM